jgi:hypothetical protein
VRPGIGEDQDPLLDRFITTYEVVERHNVRVRAPADITSAAARDVDLLQSAVIRAIFKSRELIMGADPEGSKRPRGLVAFTHARSSDGTGRSCRPALC